MIRARHVEIWWIFLTLSEPDARLEGNQVPPTVMSNQSSGDCINIYKRSVLLDGCIVYRLWSVAPSSAFHINPLYSSTDLKQLWRKKKNCWLLDCTRSEELKRVPVNEIKPPEFRVPAVQGEGTHALAEGDSLQRLVLWGKDKDVFWVQMLLWCSFVRAPKKEVINSPSRQTSWHSCHRSRTSGGGTGSVENRTLSANTLMTQTNGKSETLLKAVQRFSICSAVFQSLCLFVPLGLL